MDAKEEKLFRENLALIGPFEAESCVNGTITVKPRWSAWDGKPGWLRETQEDIDEAGGPGVLERMQAAEIIAEWLNAAGKQGE